MKIKLKSANYLFIGLFIMNFATANSGQGQIVVIVNKANPVTNISKANLLNFYLGNEIVWENSNRIYPITQRTNQSIAKIFFQKGLGKTVGRMKRIWLKLSLSGKTSPPKILNSADEVIEYISQNEGAIGFIPIKKLNENVRVIKIDGKAYNEKEYFLNRKTE